MDGGRKIGGIDNLKQRPPLNPLLMEAVASFCASATAHISLFSVKALPNSSGER